METHGNLKRTVMPFIIIVSFFLGCCACKEGQKDELSTLNKVQRELDEIYEQLNYGLLGTDHIRWASKLMENGAYVMSEEVKGEFVPVTENYSVFPQELVVRLEEAFYYSCNTKSRGEDSAYYKLLMDLGGDDFVVGLEEIYYLFPLLDAYSEQIQKEEDAFGLIHELMGGPVDCRKMFHFRTEDGTEQYVFVWQSGGSDGVFSVLQARLQDNRFVTINEFEIPNEGEGRVIQYNKEFYYVFLQYNYNLKYYDGVRIYKLAASPGTENLQIRYLPEEFIWENIYDAGSDELEEYLQVVKKGFEIGYYLDNGRDGEYLEIYYGGEKETSDFDLGEYDTYYKMDIANCNTLVYFAKNMYIPSDIRSRCHLKIRFFLYNDITDSVMELKELGIDDDGGWVNLLQMWFEEIDGKVYTFSIYHITDYNYMLEVALLEGDRLTHVKTVLLMPKRKFVLTEGEIFNVRG